MHKKLRAILAGKGDSLPSGRRAAHNLSCRLRDALICALCIFFFQRPSAPAFRRQMQEKRRRNNIASIFGAGEIPSGTRIKTLLDRIEPDAFGGVFDDSPARRRSAARWIRTARWTACDTTRRRT